MSTEMIVSFFCPRVTYRGSGLMLQSIVIQTAIMCTACL